MKKIVYLVLLIVLAHSSAGYTPSNFPDENFRRAVEKYDGGHVLILSNMGISDLTGLEYLNNVHYLDISDNPISEFDPGVLPNLEILICSNTDLVEIDLTNSPNVRKLVGNSTRISKVIIPENSKLSIVSLEKSHMHDLSAFMDLNLFYFDIRNCDLDRNDYDDLMNLNVRGTFKYLPQRTYDNYGDFEYVKYEDERPININVLVLDFEDTSIPRSRESIHIDALIDGYRFDLSRASRGYIETNIVDYIHIDGPPPMKDNIIDYNVIIDLYGDIVNRVNNYEIDEVWIFTNPGYFLWESNMMGPDPIWVNSTPHMRPDLKRNVIVMGFHKTRVPDLHHLGHRAESTMKHFYGRWKTNSENPNNWEKFTSTNYEGKWSHPIGAGNCHFPPNVVDLSVHYNYYSELEVECTAYDWDNYPNLTGDTSMVSSKDWEVFGVRNKYRSYMIWWFNRFPQSQGTNEDGHPNNWWKYLFDYNRYMLDEVELPPTPTPTHVPTNTPTPTSTPTFTLTPTPTITPTPVIKPYLHVYDDMKSKSDLSGSVDIDVNPELYISWNIPGEVDLLMSRNNGPFVRLTTCQSGYLWNALSKSIHKPKFWETYAFRVVSGGRSIYSNGSVFMME